MKAPASNALLVSAKESETDNPLEIGAPQVGYANPAFFMDIDVHVARMLPTSAARRCPERRR